MAVLKNARHERYVQNLIAGMSQRQAYRDAFPNSEKWKDATVDSKASELFSGKILERYQEIAEEAKDKAIIQRKDRMVLLSNIARDNGEKTEARIKAIDTLNKMDGEYINRVEVSGSLEAEKTKLDDLIQQMRGDG